MSLFFAFYKRMNALYNKRLNWQAKKFKSWKLAENSADILKHIMKGILV